MNQTITMNQPISLDRVEYEIPSDELVESWGEDEHRAILHAIGHGLQAQGRRITYAELALMSGMTKGQMSLLVSGERGVPMGRELFFNRACKSVALLKLKAAIAGFVLKTKAEWGALIRERNDARDERDQIKDERDQIARERDDALRRLADYEQ